MTKERKSFPLRLDPSIYEAIVEWAEQEMRSVNGQIEFLLKQAVLARRRSLREDAPPSPSADDDSGARN